MISVRVDEIVRDDGSAARREVVEHPGAVAIVPWDGERIGLVRQWRHPAAEALLEIPAGTLEPGEDPMPAAQRELGEELGLAAASWLEGPAFYSAPGFCTERLTLFLATDLAPTDVATPDDERLEREWLTVDDALAAVDDGRIADAKSIVGVLWLARSLGRS